MQRTLVLALLVVAPGLVPAAADEAKATPKVKVTGLDVHKPASSEPNFNFMAGTGLELLIRLPDRYILSIDKDASKLAAFTDDKKTDLTKTTSFFRQDWLNLWTVRTTRDGHECLFHINAPGAPADGAEKILVKASVVVLCGSEEKTVEEKDVSLKPGSKSSVGPFTLTVEKGFQPKFVQATFTSPQRNIKSVTFVDSKGQEVKTGPPGGGPTTANGKQAYTTMFFVPTDGEPVTVKVVYYSKSTPVTVPVDLSVGVGL